MRDPEAYESCMMECVHLVLSVNEDARLLSQGQAREVFEFYKDVDPESLGKVRRMSSAMAHNAFKYDDEHNDVCGPLFTHI